MPIYTIMLVLASARTGLGLIMAARLSGWSAWTPAVQGAAEVCCALLLRAWFDPPFVATLGGAIYPVFAFALIWSVAVWLRRLLGFIEEDEDTAPPSTLGAFGLAMSEGARRLVAVVWHVFFVAPSLVAGAFVVFGLAGEIRH